MNVWVLRSAGKIKSALSFVSHAPATYQPRTSHAPVNWLRRFFPGQTTQPLHSIFPNGFGEVPGRSCPRNAMACAIQGMTAREETTVGFLCSRTLKTALWISYEQAAQGILASLPEPKYVGKPPIFESLYPTWDLSQFFQSPSTVHWACFNSNKMTPKPITRNQLGCRIDSESIGHQT